MMRLLFGTIVMLFATASSAWAADPAAPLERVTVSILTIEAADFVAKLREFGSANGIRAELYPPLNGNYFVTLYYHDWLITASTDPYNAAVFNIGIYQEKRETRGNEDDARSIFFRLVDDIRKLPGVAVAEKK